MDSWVSCSNKLREYFSKCLRNEAREDNPFSNFSKLTRTSVNGLPRSFATT